MPVRFSVPLPGPFTYTAKLRPSRTAGCLTQVAFWLILGPVLVALIAIWGAVWMIVAAVMIGLAIWKGILTMLATAVRR